MIDGTEVASVGADLSLQKRFFFGECQSLDLVNITIEIQFDRCPYQIGYSITEIIDGSGNAVHEANGNNHISHLQYDKMVETIQVIGNATYEFHINDEKGDGLTAGGGHYAVYMGDKVDHSKLLVFGGPDFGSNNTESFVASGGNIIEYNTTSIQSSHQSTNSSNYDTP